MDEKLITLLSSPLNTERLNTTENVLLLIKQRKLTKEKLFPYFDIGNVYLTSSIMYILCHLDIESAKKCLDLYQGLYETSAKIFTEKELLKPNNIGIKLQISFKENFKDKKFFDLLIKKLNNLRVACYQIRRRVLLRHIDELHLITIKVHISKDLDYIKVREPLTEKEINTAANLNLERIPNLAFTQFLEERENAILHFHYDLSEQFHDYVCYESVKGQNLYDDTQLQYLNDTTIIESLVGLDNVYRNICSYVINKQYGFELTKYDHSLKEYEKQEDTTPKKNNKIGPDHLWSIINNDFHWYKQLDVEAYFNHKITNAMFKLIKLGDKAAFKLFYDISKFYMIDKNEVPSSLDFYCSMFSEALNINFQKSRYQMKIGLEWEDLCFKIAKDKMLDIISHPILANRSIPDMAINYQKNSKYKTIIECKKSLYFARAELSNEIDINNNPTSSNYLPFCSELQYWILENKNYDPNLVIHNSIKVYFSNDFLEDEEISIKTKEDIIGLQRKARKKTDSNFEHLDVIEWIDELKSLEEATYLKINQLSILDFANDFDIVPSTSLQKKVLQLPNYEAIMNINKFISSSQAKSSTDIENLIDQLTEL